MMVSCLAITAQKDVTTFLGIPVDGYKSEMRKKLISKGYTPKQIPKGQEYFEGEFNGTDVHVYIVTNNNKVYRIMLCDANTQNETNIKIRFNRLVSQFENNNRYTAFDKYSIPEEEDISYEMNVRKKNYEAVFFQKPNDEKIDTTALKNQIRQELLSKYTEEQLNNPTEEIRNDWFSTGLKIGIDIISKKPVWFRIVEDYGQYYITMFYDNEYNHANGEDL